jgi:hypothetical protein
MALLAKMVGSRLETEDGEPGEVPRNLAPRPASAPGRALRRGMRAAAPYGAVVGGTAVLSLMTGTPDWFTLMAAGGCFAHAGDRVIEGVRHGSRGGRFFERRRRKYQGEAGLLDIRAGLSVRAAVREMARLAPGLPASQAHITLGTSLGRPAQTVAVHRATSILVVAPPQVVKTVFISRVALEAPGALLCTSSRADQYRQTVAVREQLGPVLTLDADGDGPGTNFGWDPVGGCLNPKIAKRRAGDFMHASPRDPSGKDRWHEDRGARLLMLALHAAALTHRDMRAVRSWCQYPEQEDFLKALRTPRAAEGWGDTLESLLAQEGEFLNSATTSAEAALGWMDDPDMRAVACPGRAGLDVAGFLRQGTGTVYLIGMERPYGSLTPYFTAFVTEYMEQARHLAERSPGGRLPVPMTLALDEAATTARVDLPRWLAVTAGYNITAVVGLQAISQLAANWGGQDQAEIILNLLNTKIIGGGVTSPADLERLSVICGQHRVWRKEYGRKVHEQVPVFPPERIRMLPKQHALVVDRSSKAVEVRAAVVWEHPDFAPVSFADRPEDAEFTEPPESAPAVAPVTPLHVVGETAAAG